ncbi:serine/threonine-protein kinase Nek5 [Silurus meridionalis]|nr:serine/threonine-protein kinase Nek5 [Silurus meridionalis]
MERYMVLGHIGEGAFGKALLARESTAELVMTWVGTPNYISPEICENRPYNNKTLLLSQVFKVSPQDRPSVNTLLKNPLLHGRISKHLDPQVMEEEFSHQILHKDKPVAQHVNMHIADMENALKQVLQQNQKESRERRRKYKVRVRSCTRRRMKLLIGTESLQFFSTQKAVMFEIKLQDDREQGEREKEEQETEEQNEVGCQEKSANHKLSRPAGKADVKPEERVEEEEESEGEKRVRRGLWRHEAPQTLLNALANMKVFMYSSTQGTVNPLDKGNTPEDEKEKSVEAKKTEDKEEDYSDVELDKERLEPRSDDDDTRVLIGFRFRSVSHDRFLHTSDSKLKMDQHLLTSKLTA